MVPDLMRRIYGSDDFFPDSRGDADHAYQSVNYIASHDGFTLFDLVSYDRKHNLKNGHNNQDGMDENYSWNCGHEGDEAVPSEVLALRRKQVKNFCCLLLLSNGETGWLDWSQLQTNQDVFRFFKGMIAFRKRSS